MSESISLTNQDDICSVQEASLDLVPLFSINDQFENYAGLLRDRLFKNKKVLLIQTPQFQFETFNVDVARNRGIYAYPPTGLQCVAKVLSSQGADVSILDLNYEILKRVVLEHGDITQWISLIDDALEKYNPSLIGITSLTSYNDVLRPFHPLTSLLLRLREKSNAIVVVGGPTVTNEYEEYLNQKLCHFVILKEGEQKAKFLFEFLSGSKDISSCVSGIAFPGNEKIEVTTGKDTLLQLSGNIIDTYSLIPIEKYNQIGSLSPYSRMAGMEKPFSGFQVNRGCRANCKFCDVSKFMGRGVRSYGAQEVFEELRYLVIERGIRHFEVLDDDFLGNMSTIKELLRLMAPLHKDYNMTWSANNGLIAGSLTEEMCALLRDSGCIGFRIGVESGNPEMIRRLRKPATLDLLLQKGKLLHQFPQMFTGANYILGLFGEETFSQMMDTFHFSNKINLDWSSFSTFQFTSRETATIEHFNSKGKIAGEFTPSKDNIRGEIPECDGIISGPDVFLIDFTTVPLPLQVKQIWFTFNLVGNYINNKNIRFGGHPDKFVRWVEAVGVVYPYNPYMPLFAALGQVLLGEQEKALQNLKRAKENVKNSAYWQHRFEQFHLQEILDHFPSTAEEVYTTVEMMRGYYKEWI